MLSVVFGWEDDARAVRLRATFNFLFNIVVGLIMFYMVSSDFGTDKQALWFGIMVCMPWALPATLIFTPLRSGWSINSIFYTIFIFSAGLCGSTMVFLVFPFILGSLR